MAQHTLERAAGVDSPVVDVRGGGQVAVGQLDQFSCKRGPRRRMCCQ
jgi:hypothetical protein